MESIDGDDLAALSKRGGRIAQRAKIVTLSAGGMSQAAIARELGCSRVTVRKWARGCGAQGLEDAPRCGAPPRLPIGSERRVLGYALFERREDGRFWSCRSLGKELGLNYRFVARVFRRYGLGRKASEEVSQAQLAEKLGLAESTVSRALGNRPGVAKATRARVTKTARAIGWRPQPGDAIRTSSRRTCAEADVTLLVFGMREESWEEDSWQRAVLEAAERRVEGLGGSARRVWVGDPALKGWKLNAYLRDSGTRGVLLMPSQEGQKAAELFWDRYALATVDPCPAPGFPTAFLAGCDHFEGAMLAMDRWLPLNQASGGAGRLGFMATRAELAGLAGKALSAYLWQTRHSGVGLARLEPLELEEAADAASVGAWLEQFAPEGALCSPRCEVALAEALKRTGRSVEPISLRATSERNWAGLWQLPDAIGRRSGDYLMASIRQGRRGPLAQKMRSLTRGVWVEAGDVRPALETTKPSRSEAGSERARPDPTASELSRARRLGRPARRPALGMLYSPRHWDRNDPQPNRMSSTVRDWALAFDATARQLGFEPLIVTWEGAATLQRRFRGKDLRGVCLHLDPEDSFDTDCLPKYVAVLEWGFRSNERRPTMVVDAYQGLRSALEPACAVGAQRVGFLVHGEWDAISGGQHTGAFQSLVRELWGVAADFPVISLESWDSNHIGRLLDRAGDLDAILLWAHTVAEMRTAKAELERRSIAQGRRILIYSNLGYDHWSGRAEASGPLGSGWEIGCRVAEELAAMVCVGGAGQEAIGFRTEFALPWREATAQ